MLIYTKVIDKVKHLYGTLDHVPSDSDTELTYVDAQGEELEIIPKDTYLDNHKGGIVRKSDGSAVNVFLGDTQIIGETPVTEES